MKFNLVYIFLILFVYKAIAEVSVIDEHQILEEKHTMFVYLSEVKSAFEVVSNTNDIHEQLSSLNQLIELQQEILKLCAQSCTRNEINQINQYLYNISSNFATQFKSLAKIATNISDLQSVKKYISGISTDSKVINLALQKAALEEQQNTNMLLINYQQMLVLKNVQQNIEKKIEQHEADAVYYGFTHSGL